METKQAEKLKSREMKEGCIKNGEGWMKNDKVWMKNDEGWKMKDEGWWFQAVEGFCFRTDERMDGQTFAIVESLLWLKISWQLHLW